MTLLVARLLISVALLCSPFALIVIGSVGRRNAGSLIWLLIPFFGGVPAVLGALLVFAPLEGILDARGLGHLKNVAVPLAGALLIVIFVVGSLGARGKLAMLRTRIASGGINVIGPMLLWSALGVIWGVLWRLSEWIATRAGIVADA
jgi:hypothetical protein